MRYQAHTQAGDFTSKLNWLRASVLGANDGIISIAALLVGVASASASTDILLLTGVAGLLSGAFSMAAGEYVSVSSQRDTEQVVLKQERYEIEQTGTSELIEVVATFDPNNLTNPWHASIASAISYTLGGLIPLVAILLPQSENRVLVTVISVLIALVVTGILSARVTGASKTRTVFRVVVGGFLAMAITFAIGTLFNVSGL